MRTWTCKVLVLEVVRRTDKFSQGKGLQYLNDERSSSYNPTLVKFRYPRGKEMMHLPLASPY